MFKTANRKKPVRLANVEAPEKGRPGADKATETLRKLIQDEAVTIETVAREPYGWSVAKVKVGRRSVNGAMEDKLK